jgi:predicted transcriptional regulator of viral defense system
MYIINKHSKNDRFAKLAAMGEQVFHIDDLANIWGITNKQTLRVTLSRYVKAGMLKRIYRGLYAIKDISEIDPRLVGVKAIHGPAYISCETILFDYGVINQVPRVISIMSGSSKAFSIGGRDFRSKKMKPQFLHNDAGIKIENGVRTASLERALADAYYFNPQKYIDAIDKYEVNNLIDWDKYEEIINTVGYNSQIKKYVHHPR